MCHQPPIHRPPYKVLLNMKCKFNICRLLPVCACAHECCRAMGPLLYSATEQSTLAIDKLPVPCSHSLTSRCVKKRAASYAISARVCMKVYRLVAIWRRNRTTLPVPLLPPSFQFCQTHPVQSQCAPVPSAFFDIFSSFLALSVAEISMDIPSRGHSSMVNFT